MNAVLWIAQVLLALAFLAAGSMKLARSKEALLPKMPILAGYRPVTIKAIGLAEVAGALGVVLPLATGVAPGLTPWAALGLAAVAVGAAIVHAERADYKPLAVHAALLALALVVVYGRSADLPV